MTNCLRIFRKMPLYLLWCLFVLAIASFVFEVIWGNNSQGDSCDILLWNYGELYQALDGSPCVFTKEFYLAAYISYLILYLLFDYVRCKIVGMSPSLLWRISEIGVVFIIYWLSIVYKWSDFVMVYTSLLGSLQFLWPFFVAAIVVKYIKPNILLFGIVLLGILLLVMFVMWGHSRYKFIDNCIAEGNSQSWCLETWQEVDDL